MKGGDGTVGMIGGFIETGYIDARDPSGDSFKTRQTVRPRIEVFEEPGQQGFSLSD
jgi:hypothetical protein